ncbi:DUF1499 domain-containing protein [Jannaschia helgolandensis]|uniref:DUF1499 domain-containing protein n=1 Tax=Jannaschia helgolandensis TaxID=188906 RepID=UPI0030D9BF49|tara:strand:+ start:505 stop:960 length:456 start_codon:yes stop_codon:yes gene_type:complete
MIIRSLVLAAVGLTALGLTYVRIAPTDPAVWHVDPTKAIRSGKPNDYLVADGGDRPAIVSDVPPADLLSRIDAVAMAEVGVTRLAGSPDEGLITYVQRSRVIGFPDAISVSARPDGMDSRLSIWSRSRYGQYDFGVNRARVERWLAALNLG